MSVDDSPSEMIVEETPIGTSDATNADVSALEHNIQSKGKNVYYFGELAVVSVVVSSGEIWF